MVTCKLLRFTVILLTGFSIYFPASAQLPVNEWVKQFGFGANLLSEPRHMLTDAEGNVYVSGTFEATNDFDPGQGVHTLTSSGGSDVFILKLNAAGDLVWINHAGGLSDETVYNMIFDAEGNLYIGGYYTQQAVFTNGNSAITLAGDSTNSYYYPYVCKLTRNGNLLWAKTMTYPSAFDTQGNMLFAGIFTGTKDFDDGAGVNELTAVSNLGDIFIKKTDNSGNLLWVKQVKGTSQDMLMRAGSVKTDAADNIVLTGRFNNGGADINTGTGVQEVQADNGDVGFILKLNAPGDFIWANAYAASNSSVYIRSVAIDTASDIYVSGSFWGNVDFDAGNGSHTISSDQERLFVMKIDALGNFLWENDTSLLNTNIPSMGVSANGEVYMGGWNGYLTKFDNNGIKVWDIALDAGDVVNSSLQVDGMFNIYLAGIFKGSADFAPGNAEDIHTASVADSYEIFLHKLNQQAQYPVNFSLFEVTTDNDFNLLHWQVPVTFITGHFEVERSINDAAFVRIAEIPSAGSTTSYRLNDPVRAEGKVTYRVKYFVNGEERKLTDDIVIVTETKTDLAAFPNPVNNILFLKGKILPGAVIEVFDVYGHLVSTQKNNEATKGEIGCSRLARGTYILKITGKGNNVMTRRIVKL